MTERLPRSVDDDANNGRAAGQHYWHVPHNRNPHFTGRERVLELLARALDGNDSDSRRQVLHGVGGVGKTHVALEYAFQHREEYDLVWWFTAHDESALNVAYAKMVRTLGGNPAVDATADELRLVMITAPRSAVMGT